MVITYCYARRTDRTKLALCERSHIVQSMESFEQNTVQASRMEPFGENGGWGYGGYCLGRNLYGGTYPKYFAHGVKHSLTLSIYITKLP